MISPERGFASMEVVMATVPIPDKLLWPTMVALKALGGSASNDELLEKIIEIEGISDKVASVIHSDKRQTKLSYNLAWARTNLKKIGAIDNSSRGVWVLLPAGEKLTQEEVEAIPRLRRNKIRKQGAEKQPEGSPEEDVSPRSWKDELVQKLRAMAPSAFERLAQRLLRETGFIRVEVLGKSGDGGVDGVGVLQINLISFRVYFQCKRYTGSVGAAAIRDFRGAMAGRSDKGIFITTATFTADAKKEASRDGAIPIDLIDGDRLCVLLKDLKLGVKVELIEQITVQEGYFESV
jgi:restriction system protein